jgi:hypothetical protein
MQPRNENLVVVDLVVLRFLLAKMLHAILHSESSKCFSTPILKTSTPSTITRICLDYFPEQKQDRQKHCFDANAMLCMIAKHS